MIRRFLSLLLILIGGATAAAAEPRVVPQVSAGRIVDLGIIHSRFSDPRRVMVWLPPGYSATAAPAAVLYMHDGQNLFDKATAGYGMEWGIDETLDRLIRERKVRPTIVVGIWNTPKRLREYVPSKAFDRLPRHYMDRVRGLYGGDPLSDGYLRFLVRELKPLIDHRFNVARGRDDTVIMGSSMGALVSLYAIDEYPRIFGAAGMMSTHWPLFLPEPGKALSDAEVDTVASAFEAYLRSGLASPASHRLYFDHGSETLDAHYAAYQERIDKLLAASGYRQGRSLLSREFPGQKHNELSWASRVEIPLRFLLPPRVRRGGRHG
jgi:enterochelin esterase-like enzyme